MEKHSFVAGPFGISLVYEDGLTILLATITPARWRAVIVVPVDLTDQAADSVRICEDAVEELGVLLGEKAPLTHKRIPDGPEWEDED